VKGEGYIKNMVLNPLLFHRNVIVYTVFNAIRTVIKLQKN